MSPELGSARRTSKGVKGPGCRRVDADYRTTAFEPNTRLAFAATAGPVRPTGDYLIEEVGAEHA